MTGFQKKKKKKNELVAGAKIILNFLLQVIFMNLEWSVYYIFFLPW